MVNSLKKLDKKFLIVAALIICIPIVLIVFLAIIQGCSDRKITYDKYESKMISAAEKYFKKDQKLPKEESKTKSVSLAKLIELEYIKSTEKLLDDSSCTGEVSVRLNGSNVESNEGGFYNYTVKLSCEDHETNSLNNLVMKDIVTEGSGLYQYGDYYIYKGDETKNYINVYGKEYRIISIDSDGLAKLIRIEEEPLDKYWDIKYNSEIDNSYGKNIYKDSNVLKELMVDYLNPKKINKSTRQHIVSKDICIDSRDINNTSMSNEVECSEVLANQVISLIGVTDFANASLDAECNSIVSKSCKNYNYLKSLGLQTWTYVPVSNNTYEVYYLRNGVIEYQEASRYESYNIVIYIDSNEFIDSGNGSKTSPYVIE